MDHRGGGHSDAETNRLIAPRNTIAVPGHGDFAHEIRRPLYAEGLEAPPTYRDSETEFCVTQYPSEQCTCGEFLITWGAGFGPGRPSWLE
jgi:hypothetical protein